MISLFPEDSEFLKADSRGKRWAIPYNFECLNARVEKLLIENEKYIQGKRILDLASHIGTFSYAALKLGATYVKGIDTEKNLINQSIDLFNKQTIDSSLYQFKVADAFDYLEKATEGEYDTIFCFGLLYYTAEPFRLLKLMKRATKDCILLDTFTSYYAALQGKDSQAILPNIKEETLDLPLMIVNLTQSEKKDYSLPDGFQYKNKNLNITTFTSKALLEIWFESLNLQFCFLDWAQYFKKTCHWKNLISPEQKNNSHWADVYSSKVRVAYRLNK